MDDKNTKRLAIVAMGPSHRDYVQAVMRSGCSSTIADEVWAINAAADVIRHDKAVIMDDLRLFVRRMEDEGRPGYTEWMTRHDKPIITSTAYDEFPTSERFPLEPVLQDLKTPYFNSTVAYALALAIHEGFAKISLYGCDFTYPDVERAEAGRGCVEYWMGRAVERDIQLGIGQSTSLMDMIVPNGIKFYGYVEPVDYRITEDGVTVKQGDGISQEEAENAEWTMVNGRYVIQNLVR